MTDREPRFIEPRILTPEYWGGHGTNDVCDPKNTSGEDLTFSLMRQQSKGRKFARPILEDFLDTSDKHPIRTYTKGELFLADQFSEGTIVQFEREQLLMGNETTSASHYKRERWGVIYGYEINGERKSAVMDFGVYKNHIVAAGFRHHDLPSTIGEVVHSKGDNGESDFLKRVNYLAVYESGKRVGQEVKKRSFVQKFGTVWKPQTNEFQIPNE